MATESAIIRMRKILESKGISQDLLKDTLMVYGRDWLREVEGDVVGEEALAARRTKAFRMVADSCPDLFPLKD